MFIHGHCSLLTIRNKEAKKTSLAVEITNSSIPLNFEEVRCPIFSCKEQTAFVSLKDTFIIALLNKQRLDSVYHFTSCYFFVWPSFMFLSTMLIRIPNNRRFEYFDKTH